MSATGGCRENTSPCHPAAVDDVLENRSGLPALRYRVAPYGVALRRMLAGVAEQEPLRSLTTREPEDPALALLDAFAVVEDVLSFYQERILNEGFLRTATERRSVLELARAVSYELGSGVAAETYLAFTVDDLPGSPGWARIDPGLKVMSVPGPDETAQMFETVGGLDAQGAWNSMRPRQTRPAGFSRGGRHVWVQGAELAIRPGDGILVIDDAVLSAWPKGADQAAKVHFSTVVEASPQHDPGDPAAGTTRITWAEPLPDEWSPSTSVSVYLFRGRAALFGHNAPNPCTLQLDAKFEGCDCTSSSVPAIAKYDESTCEWCVMTVVAGSDGILKVDLDAKYPAVTPYSADEANGWVVLRGSNSSAHLYRIDSVSTRGRADYLLSGQVTRMNATGKKAAETFSIRNTAVFVQSERLELAPEPDPDPVTGPGIYLDREVPWLADGQPVLLVQEVEEGVSETPAPRLAFVDAAGRTPQATTVRLELRNSDGTPFTESFPRRSLRISGNVVRATHGEGVTEVLGGGDGSRPHQTFSLRKKPLTFTSAPSGDGAASSLELRVEGVLWREEPSLYGLQPTAEAFEVRLDEDGGATVRFGDGAMGARLPTGASNVTAAYRAGLGVDGEVRARTLTALQTRPLGIKEVTNPLPADGAQDPEPLEEARRNAPRQVLTFDRIVSISDFEDFARGFRGIGKARVATFLDQEVPLAHLSVAPAGGGAFEPTAPTLDNLRKAIDGARDVWPRVLVEACDELRFRLEMRVAVDPRYESQQVIAAVHEHVLDAFGFFSRELGQPVSAAEILSLAESVEGVLAAVVDALSIQPDGTVPSKPGSPRVWKHGLGERHLRTAWRGPRTPAAGRATSRVAVGEVLGARLARLEDNEVLPAELLVIDPDRLRVEELQP